MPQVRCIPWGDDAPQGPPGEDSRRSGPGDHLVELGCGQRAVGERLSSGPHSGDAYVEMAPPGRIAASAAPMDAPVTNWKPCMWPDSRGRPPAQSLAATMLRASAT